MEEDDFSMGDLMQDPEGYYPPTPPPTQQIYTLGSGKQIVLNLVGSSPTEAHHLWNGAKIITEYFEAQPSRVRGKTVLELGAAAGLPSLAAGLLGARKVVMTDFNDPDLVQNMQKNIDACDAAAEPAGSIAGRVVAEGFVWGRDVGHLLAHLEGEQEQEQEKEKEEEEKEEGKEREGRGFDVLILADLLFRHNEHGDLVKTIREAMRRSRESVTYVFFTSYRPWKRDLDMKFFDVARAAGLEVERVLEKKLEKPLFENDPGDLEVQKTVNGFEVRWPASEV